VIGVSSNDVHSIVLCLSSDDRECGDDREIAFDRSFCVGSL